MDLRDAVGHYDWRLSEKNIWKVENVLIEWPHHRIRTSRDRVARLRARYRAFRAEHGYKPWKYYHGLERWTELPAEFRENG